MMIKSRLNRLKFATFGFLILLLALSPVSSVFANGLGHGFYGTVKVAGEDASIGTVISAQVAGTEYGSWEVTTAGQYALIVQGEIEDGATIDFYVDGQKAEETFPFHDGWTTELNLTTAAPPAAPTAEFSASPRSGTAPLTVDFTDESTGDITSWSWSFGDDGTSTEQSPSYTYSDAGTYDVSLKVTGPGGADTEAKSGYITVSAAPTYYTLTVNCDPTEGGSVSLDPSQPAGGYEAGTSVQLTATAAEGYAFGSWSGDLTGSTNLDTITMNSNKSVTANFVVFTAPANVDVTAADPGIESIDVSSVELSEVNTTNMPEDVEAQEAYVVDSTGTGNFTLSFTGIANAESIVVYKVTDSDWVQLTATGSGTTLEVTIPAGDPPVVFCTPTGAPPPVGGTAYLVNKLAILAPWIAIGAAIAAGGAIFIRRRRAHG